MMGIRAPMEISEQESDAGRPCEADWKEEQKGGLAGSYPNSSGRRKLGRRH